VSVLTTISENELVVVVDSILERAELSSQYSELFVDINLLGLLKSKKNQVIFGRRGTGKTHLLGRLKEHYRDTFAETKTLPVFIDGRNIAHRAVTADSNVAISLLISYRRFLDSLITSIEEFMQDSLTLNIFEKIWPNAKKQKAERVNKTLHDLKDIIRLGQVEHGTGKVVAQSSQQQATSNKEQLDFDMKLAAGIKDLADTNATLKAVLANSSSRVSEDSIKVVYEGLTVMNFVAISQGL